MIDRDEAFDQIKSVTYQNDGIDACEMGIAELDFNIITCLKEFIYNMFLPFSIPFALCFEG